MPKLSQLFKNIGTNGNGRGDFARLVVLLGHGAARLGVALRPQLCGHEALGAHVALVAHVALGMWHGLLRTFWTRVATAQPYLKHTITYQAHAV